MEKRETQAVGSGGNCNLRPAIKRKKKKGIQGGVDQGGKKKQKKKKLRTFSRCRTARSSSGNSPAREKHLLGRERRAEATKRKIQKKFEQQTSAKTLRAAFQKFIQPRELRGK